ncbi:hypothetical protein Tco_0476376 [Tanacetum coccineum]
MTLLTRKRYRGTSELIKDTKGESSLLDSKRKGSEDEGPDSKKEEEAAPEGQPQQAVQVVDTAMDESLELGYGAARRRARELESNTVPIIFEIGQSSRDGTVFMGIECVMPQVHAPIQTPPSPAWSSGSLPVSPSSPIVPTPVASPTSRSSSSVSVELKVSLDLSRLATTLNRLERSIKFGINKCEDDEIVVKPMEVTKTVKPSFEKIESVNARNETIRQVENPRKNNKSPKGNKRNWNGMMTQKLGGNFEFNNKACYVCGSFDHLHYTCKHKRKFNDKKQVKPVWNNSKRVNHQNFGRFSHPNQKSNIVPQAVLTKSGLVSLNTAKSVSTAQSRKTMNDAMPTTYSYYKAYSSVKRPFNKKTTNYNRYFNKRVNTVKSTRVNTARPKAEVNTVKASASWVWKPKHEELDHVSKSNSASNTLTRYDYVDALGSFGESILGLVMNPSSIFLVSSSKKICSCIGMVDTALEVIISDFGYGIANGICKELASPEQTTSELAIPGQTATGKESSNPFMAGSLPKTIHFCDSLQSDEDSFELIELMILCTNFLNMVRDLENLKTTYLIIKKVWVRMHPNRGGLMMQKQRLPSLMRLQMMLETRTTRFQTAIRSEEVFGYILLVAFQGGLLHDHAQRLDALPPTLFEGYDRDLREFYTSHGQDMLTPRGQRCGKARYDDHRLIQELRDRVTTLEQEGSQKGQ